MSVFGTARWDTDVWGGTRDRPGAGWGTKWRVWYQVGPTVGPDLTELCVEIRWTTDSHTTADGTFRGDLQPGKAAIRFWDPGHTMEALSKMGAVWATYTPTGATWCWFYDSVQRALVAPGDPQGADVVFNGTTWPARLTLPMDYLNFPAQSINARLAALVAAMQSHTELNLPAVTLIQDPAGQLVSPPTLDSSWLPGAGGANRYPSYLDQIRAAAANGVCWWAYGRDASGAGTLTLRYTDWDNVAPNRLLDGSQIVAGPPVTQSVEWVINMGRFTATKGDTAATTVVVYEDTTSAPKYGQSVVDLRMWGDVSGPGPEHGAASTVLGSLINYHRDPAAQTLSSVTLQSGPRWTPAGLPSKSPWDPTAHVWAPNEVAQYKRTGSAFDYYRIAKSDHVLNAANWQSTHTLDLYVAAAPLP